jgi:hypothetical protein
MGLVEMDMAFDEGRQKQISGEIDALVRSRRLPRLRDRRHDPVGDRYVGADALRQESIGQPHQMRRNRFAAAYL